MRKWLLVLCFLMLTGCGTQLPQSAYEDGAVMELDTGTLPTGITMECEWTEYDLDAEKIVFLVHNNTDMTIETGVSFSMEVCTDGSWSGIPMIENAAWPAVGINIEPGTTRAFSGVFSVYDHDFHPGLYRVCKKMNGEVYTAVFFMAENSGKMLEPLEEWESTENCLMIQDDVITQNAESAVQFLEKVKLEMDCQLRRVEYASDDVVSVIDVIHEDGRFLVRRLRSGAVTENFYSYIVTDGEDLYLSNCADWGLSYPDVPLLLLPGAAPDWIGQVEEMTAARLENNTTRCRLWSPDGEMYGILTDVPTEFGISGDGGAMEDLQDRDGLETAIESMAWEGDTLLLTCSTVDGGTSVLRARLEKNPIRITVTTA